MKSRIKLIGVWSAVLLAASSQGTVSAAPGPADIAVQYLAQQLGQSPGNFSLVASGTGAIPFAGDQVWFGKFLDTPTGAIVGAYVDATGLAFGPDEYRHREEAAEALLTPFDRKADPGLKQYIAAHHPAADQLIPIQVWVAADTDQAVGAVKASLPSVDWSLGKPTSNDATLARQARGAVYTAKEQIYAAAEEALATTITQMGGTPGYGSTSAPLLFAELPAGALGDLAARDEVRDVGLDATGWAEALQYANPTVQAHWASDSSDQGTNSRVADVEYYNVHNTGDLAGKVVAYHSTSGTITYSPSFDHPTWVAGAVASQNSTYRGIAPGAVIISSSTGGGGSGLTRDQAVIAAADWAISSSGGNADIVNTSLCQDTSTGADEARKYFDAILFED